MADPMRSAARRQSVSTQPVPLLTATVCFCCTWQSCAAGQHCSTGSSTFTICNWRANPLAHPPAQSWVLSLPAACYYAAHARVKTYRQQRLLRMALPSNMPRYRRAALAAHHKTRCRARRAFPLPPAQMPATTSRFQRSEYVVTSWRIRVAHSSGRRRTRSSEAWRTCRQTRLV